MSSYNLYRLFDDAGTLLYVGVTNNLVRRAEHHHRHQAWSWQIAHIQVEQHESKAQALAAEARDIWAWNPIWNDRHGTHRRGNNADLQSCPFNKYLLQLDRVSLVQVKTWGGSVHPEVRIRQIQRVEHARFRRNAWMDRSGLEAYGVNDPMPYEAMNWPFWTGLVECEEEPA